MMTGDGTVPEPIGPLIRMVGTFLPDVARMFAGVIRDPRVPAVAKVQAGALLALGLSPIDAIPVVGQVELVAMIALAARQLVKHAGEDVLHEHWSGPEDGFRVVMLLVDAGLRPRKLLLRLLRSKPSSER